MIVTLCHEGVRKNKRVHRLLAEAFLPNPQNKAHINHVDGNKLNNSLSNLEWSTPRENTNHSIKMGFHDPTTLRNREIVQLDKETKTVVAEFPSLHEAGRSTGIVWQNIWKVCDGRRKSAGGFAWAYK
ncbi:HNH endonuclease [Acinetobacter baumannii]